MLILNFSHPLTAEHVAQIKALTGAPVERVLDFPAHFDPAQLFTPQVTALVDSSELTPREWQTLPILINPPSLNVISAVLLAELHGRMGYFPPVLRLRSIEDALPPRFEVAEIINLQAVREQARQRR
ncbi:MAG: hypothetical protein BWY63_00747 [Chloroflexi bacterium ADurb.Bin360]|nr:MAG: hypothetical protein BWY63_00747 [Chloroflexi bacterium ADurb.Bin360]